MAESRSNVRWTVKVRLSDGSQRFYAPDSERGGQSDWRPRENQARGFDTREEAERLAHRFVTNSDAWEYCVVPLQG